MTTVERLIPIDRDIYQSIFTGYNGAIWPAQLLALAAGIVVLLALLQPSPERNRAVATALAVFWAWSGAAFEIGHHALYNWGAWVLGALCILQALLLVWAGIIRGRLDFWLGFDRRGFLVLALALASALPPLAASVTGRTFAEAQPFGLAPLPTALFTLAVLLAATARPPRYLLAVPVLIAVAEGGLALGLGVPADAALGLSVLVTAGLAFRMAGSGR